MSDEIPSNTDVLAGITKGLLEHAEEKALAWVERFRNHEIVFVEDSDTIDRVKKQRKSPEWKILSDVLKDKKLRLLAQMGLALRELENDQERTQSLRNKIHHRYGRDGLHIAEAVQNNIISNFIGLESPNIGEPVDLTIRVENLLNNIEKYIVFIGPEDKEEVLVRRVCIRLDADVPDTLILFGAYKAKRVAISVRGKIEKAFPSYATSSIETKIKIIIFINRLN
ncbi:MAG TPA: hypothetical protein PLC39_05085 [Methanomassiliicoccales archaeon]|nr:hypothetical protein [Methanomassiliicoccales archaeon]HPR98654.1 hypothetical protein [Methanomassiliicoccales archaeon]